MDPSALITLVALAAAAMLVGVAVRTDLSERRIPNGVVLALVGVWLLWRLALGACACWMELAGQLDSSFPLEMRFCAAAWDAMPLGLPAAVDGLLAAVVFGIGLLALALIYEAALKREAMGGGDVKLMAALALFLGFERGVLCLLVACAAALVGAAMMRQRKRGCGLSGEEASAARAQSKEAVRTERKKDAECEARTDAPVAVAEEALPFAPALACGAAVALLPGVIFWLM